MAFALCVALFTGTTTLYMLNKPATAMTEDGAKQIGLVLETADSDWEEGMIDKMNSDDTDAVLAASSDDSHITDTDNGDGDNADSSVDGSSGAPTDTSTDASSGASSDSSTDASSGSSTDSSADASTGASTDDESASSDASSLASSEELASTDASSGASSGESSTDASSLEASDTDKDKDNDSESASVEAKEDVVITVCYEDIKGEALSESKELSISESFILPDEARSFEGYNFSKGEINGTQITALYKKTATLSVIEDDEEEEDEESDSAAAYAASTDDVEEVTYTYYEAATATGETVEITENADLHLSYYKINTVTEFKGGDSKVTVKAVLSDPNALPEGIELVVTEITEDSENYNYGAYMQALNNNSKSIAEEKDIEDEQTYDKSNTLLYDIAFKLGGVEYQPKAGTVAISMELNNNQLSDSLGAVDPESVGVVHLPISEEIMETVDATSDATDISASDVAVEIVKESDIDLSGDSDSVSFETESFSAYALIYVNGQIVSWEGSETMSAQQIVKELGDNTMFGAVANTYESTGTADIEANIAVGTLKSIIEFGNTSTVYTHISFDGYYITKNSTSDGTFHFGLYSEKYSESNRNPKNIGYFDITVTNGTGTVSLTDIFSKSELQKYSRLYVYELESNRGSIVPDSETYTAEDGRKYTVTYGSGDLATESDNDIIGSFSSSYIENNATGANLYGKLQKVNGNTVYVKNSDNSYTVYTYPEGESGTKVEGAFPISVGNMLGTAKNVSQKLAVLKNSDDVVVVNAVGTKDGFRKDVAKAYFKTFNENTLNNGLTNEGITIGNKMLIINLDLTLCNGSYKLEQFKVNTNSQSTLTGNGWEELANQIIINPLQRTADNTLIPYTGELILDTVSGTILAPAAKVDVNNGAQPGAVIADYIIQRREIHKLTVRRYLSEQAKMEINNVSEDADSYEIKVDKYIDDKLATDADSGKFSFTLVMLRTNEYGGKYWEYITTLTNEGSSIKYDLKPAMLGMKYGNGNTKEDQDAHTYYFALFENDIASGQYEKDSTSILIKIKYYKGGDKDPLFYRIDASESSDLQNNPGTGLYNTQHRIGDKSNKDKGKLFQNIAFYNKRSETVDIEVTKAWILNGRNAQDIPSDPSKVVLTLYQKVGAVITPVDASKYPYTVWTNQAATDVEKADTAWKFIWTKLPKYDENGNLIAYLVAETTVPDGFSTDTKADAPKTIVFGNEEYHNNETGSTALGKATVTNKGVSLKLQFYKYLDNNLTGEGFDFRIKILEFNKGKNEAEGRFKWISHDDTHLVNDESGLISYTIDPARYGFTYGNTYILRVDEYSKNEDNHYKNKSYTLKNYPNINRDKGIILIKVEYNSANDIGISYYRIDDKDTVKAIADNCTIAQNYCIPQYEVTDQKVAFYNSTSDNITVSVTKVWDELVGCAKDNKAVADSIWDVTVRLLRSTDGQNWEIAEERTIVAPDMYQYPDGADFRGPLNDYPEDWTYDSNEGGYLSKTIEFTNLSNIFQYRIQEFYVDAYGNYNELTVGGNVVNGFKLESIHEYKDDSGDISYMLHNTPYIQIYKYWQLNGEPISDEEASGYNPVYVKLFRNYRDDKNYVQLTAEQLRAGNSSALVHETANGAIIELNAANGWYAEFALDRKQDNGPSDKHIFQYVYLIRECDQYGNDLQEASNITYGSININNVTRTPEDANYQRGFKNKIKSGETNWENAWVSGNNYPVCILNVTNNLGTNVLPKSGGIGTNMFTSAGLLMLIAAIIGSGLYFLANRKKKSKCKGFKA